MVKKTNIGSSKSKKALRERIKSVSTRKDKVHVLTHDKGWAVKKEGSSRATIISPTKSDAIHKARSIAKKGRGKDIIIHKKDGSIEKWVRSSKKK